VSTAPGAPASRWTTRMNPLGEGALRELARRPGLWPTAVAQWRALAVPGWWARWPPWPGPPDAYLAFRAQTMYGDPDAQVRAAELVDYLEWCRWMRGTAR
jgi:hypothetical protein